MNLPFHSVSKITVPNTIESNSFNATNLQNALALQPYLASNAAGQMISSASLSQPFLLSSKSDLNPLNGVKQHSPQELQKISKNFEAIFFRMLFKEMRNTVQKSNVLGNSRTMEFFEMMRDEQLSDQLASSGGLGIGKLIYNKLQEVTAPHQKTYS
jgi:Rod binding domain-containing protein